MDSLCIMMLSSCSQCWDLSMIFFPYPSAPCTAATGAAMLSLGQLRVTQHFIPPMKFPPHVFISALAVPTPVLTILQDPQCCAQHPSQPPQTPTSRPSWLQQEPAATQRHKGREQPSYLHVQSERSRLMWDSWAWGRVMVNWVLSMDLPGEITSELQLLHCWGCASSASLLLFYIYISLNSHSPVKI